MISKEMKRVNHLIGEIDAVYHEIAWKLGLSDSVFEILYTICNYGDSCMLKDICRNCGLSKQTINSALRKLEKEGIVYLEAVDSRHKKVCLTEEGRSLTRRTAESVIEAENQILASWPQEDVETYIALIRRYLLALQEKAKNLPDISEGRNS
ncbi:MAG: MarR family transcriptional regulator [Lachnospiraceae bacterium]|jgi:DNA-binding MarR family transcriptional regulator|nr:MarR family transcriptional regulator [Lachnospiraceae bacterium]